MTAKEKALDLIEKYKSFKNTIYITTTELKNNCLADHQLQFWKDVEKEIEKYNIKNSIESPWIVADAPLRKSYIQAKLEEKHDLIKEIGIVPVNTNMENKILVADIKFLPSDLKQDSTENTKEYLEEKYGHKVFLIDSSRSNVEGSSFNQPVYFI